MKASRERSEALVATVRGEVRQQLKEIGFTNVDDLAKKVADVLARSSAAGRKVTRRAAKNAKKTGPKKGGAKKSDAKKSAAKKSGQRRASTAARRRQGAKKAGGEEGGRLTPGGVRRRLDTELVRRGLAASREVRARLVEDGAVLVGGSLADKPARLVAESEPVVVIDLAARRFVSRGGDKLDAALDRFGVDPSGRRCLDAGASTGGLHRLPPAARARPPSSPWTSGTGSSTRRCDTTPGSRSWSAPTSGPCNRPIVGGPSVRPRRGRPLLHLACHRRPGPRRRSGRPRCRRRGARQTPVRGRAGRGEPGQGRDPASRGAPRRARRVASAFASQRATIMGAMASPLLGPAGNAEFLLHARAHGGSGDLSVADPRRAGGRARRRRASAPDAVADPRRPTPTSTCRRHPRPGSTSWPPSPSSCTPNGPRRPPSPGRPRRGSKTWAPRRAGRDDRPTSPATVPGPRARSSTTTVDLAVEPGRRRHHAPHRGPRLRPRHPRPRA